MTSTTDYLAFWSKAIPNLHVHPDDEAALKSTPHKFALDTLVGPWMGPIRTAPVVILMLNGGMAGNGEEARAAQMPTARESMAHNLTGDAPLPNWEGIGNPAGREWTTRRLNQFGVSYKAASDKVAFVNLIPYRSKEGAKDIRMADRLESCRVLRSWMHYTRKPRLASGSSSVCDHTGTGALSAAPTGAFPCSRRSATALVSRFTMSARRLGRPFVAPCSRRRHRS